VFEADVFSGEPKYVTETHTELSGDTCNALELAAKIYIKKKNWDKLAVIGEQLSAKYPESPFIEKINTHITN